MASTNATAKNAMEMPVRPVTARPVGTTPATTVSGAAADITKKTTAATPRRSRARAVESWLCCGGWVAVVDTRAPGGVRGGGVSGATGHDGVAHRGLGVSDQVLQHRRQATPQLVEQLTAAAGVEEDQDVLVQAGGE